MMRFNIILAGLLIAATGALARPGAVHRLPVPQNRGTRGHAFLDLSHLRLFHLFREADASEATTADPAPAHANDWSRQTPLPDLSMGPLHPELGQDDNPLAGLSAFETQDQLGSSVWKDMQNRSNTAKLMFIWPTGK